MKIPIVVYVITLQNSSSQTVLEYGLLFFDSELSTVCKKPEYGLGRAEYG